MKMLNKKFLLLAALAVVIVLTANFVFKENSTPVSDVAAELVDEKGNAVDFSEFKGKIVFVNNWASWCPPCVAEMPSIQNLKKELDGKDIVFVMVSFDQNKSKALSFMEKRKLDFDVYFPGQKYPFITPSIPTTYILDKQGKVIFEQTGMASYDKPEVISQFRELIDK